MTLLDAFELDARGLLCPEPVMMLHKEIRTRVTGDVIHMLASDPSTLRDVAKFCLFLNHELVQSQEIDDVYHFWIKKS